MKPLISILLLLAVIFVGWRLWDYWDRVNTEREEAAKQAAQKLNPRRLPGLDWQFEQSLEEAEKKGAAELKKWLDAHRRVAKDPRLAWIELDYVQLVAPQNPGEARRVFLSVKERTAPDPESPIYKRIQEMAKTYE